MSRKSWKRLTVVCIVLLSFLFGGFFILPGDGLANGENILPIFVELTGHEADSALQHTAPIQHTSVITPTSDFILYSRTDGSSWLKDEKGDSQIIVSQQARLSPDGRYIVYRDGDIHYGDIYVRDLQTDLDTLVFSNNDYVDSFSWTADGSQIVFDYSCGIYAINPDGTNQQTLIEDWPSTWDDCPNDAPHINPVDNRIVWLHWSHGIAVADADGQNPYWVPNAEDYVYPVWSPDGQWIAFFDYSNLYKIHPDGTNLTQLSFLQGSNDVEITGAWTADGNWIVAPAEIDGIMHLYVFSTNGDGRMLQMNTQTGADPNYVGSAGSVDINSIFLPLVSRD